MIEQLYHWTVEWINWLIDGLIDSNQTDKALAGKEYWLIDWLMNLGQYDEYEQARLID